MSETPSGSESARRVACPVAAVVLALAGAWAAAAVHGASPPPPAATGAERLGSPEIVLAAYDTLWALLLLPGRRLVDRLTLLLVGLPFHVALGAAASTGSGHPVAFGTLLVAYAMALSVPAPRGRFPGLALALVTCGAPLVGYALIEMAGIDANALLLCSPLTAPTMLARSARDVAESGGLPAVAGAALVLAVDQLLARLPRSTTP